MKHCQHKWVDLFPRPAKGHPRYAEGLMDRLMIQCRYDYLVCADCGCLGYVSAGRQRGGGHRIHTISEAEGAADLRARAQSWREQYCQEVTA